MTETRPGRRCELYSCLLEDCRLGRDAIAITLQDWLLLRGAGSSALDLELLFSCLT